MDYFGLSIEADPSRVRKNLTKSVYSVRDSGLGSLRYWVLGYGKLI